MSLNYNDLDQGLKEFNTDKLVKEEITIKLTFRAPMLDLQNYK